MPRRGTSNNNVQIHGWKSSPEIRDERVNGLVQDVDILVFSHLGTFMHCQIMPLMSLMPRKLCLPNRHLCPLNASSFPGIMFRR